MYKVELGSTFFVIPLPEHGSHRPITCNEMEVRNDMKMSEYELRFLMMIAEAVDEYLKHPTLFDPKNSQIVPRMVRILPRLVPTYKFSVAIEDSREPYIMSIRPDLEELGMKANDLFAVLNDPKRPTNEYLSKWAEIKTWELSIDPRILAKGTRLCVENGRQFAAILCHELGHVFNEDPIYLVANYRKSMMRASQYEKLMFCKSSVIRKLALPMFVANDSFRLIMEKPTKDKMELAADAYVPPELRGELVAYIERHLLSTPHHHNILLVREENDANQNTAIQYARGTIDLMEKRRDVLRRQISTQYNSDQNDTYTRKLMKKLGEVVGQYDPNSEKVDLVAEGLKVGIFESESRMVTELTSVMETIRVDDRKISILAIDTDGIQSSDDKLWCLQTCYDYMEAITDEKEKVIKKAGKHSTLNLNDLLDADPRYATLKDLRNKIMSKDVYADTRPRYGIFVQYPVGYEG